MSDKGVKDNTVVDDLEYRRNRRMNLEDNAFNTEYVLQLWTIANLIERDTQMWLTAEHWGKVVHELRAQYGAPSDDPPYLMMGKKPQLTVFNAGTDDQHEVNRKNQDTPGAIDFQAKKAKLRVV